MRILFSLLTNLLKVVLKDDPVAFLHPKLPYRLLKKKTLILVKGNFIFVLWTFGILSSHIFLDHMKGGFGSGRRAKRMELSR